jgi:hypothetical protein
VCLLLLEQACSVGLDLSLFLLGSGWRRGHESLGHHVAKAEGGVTVNPGLGVRPVLLGLGRPRWFGPSLSDVSWAARPTN